MTLDDFLGQEPPRGCGPAVAAWLIACGYAVDPVWRSLTAAARAARGDVLAAARREAARLGLAPVKEPAARLGDVAVVQETVAVVGIVAGQGAGGPLVALRQAPGGPPWAAVRRPFLAAWAVRHG